MWILRICLTSCSPFPSPFALSSPQPAIIATARHRKHPAHLLGSKDGVVLGYEREYRPGSVEKMASAFSKMSRSLLTRSNSFLRWRSSSSGNFTRPFPGNAYSGSSFTSRTQRRRIPLPRQRFRSTPAAGRPYSTTRRAASRLNSWSYDRRCFFVVMNTPPHQHTVPELFGVSTKLGEVQSFSIWDVPGRSSLPWDWSFGFLSFIGLWLRQEGTRNAERSLRSSSWPPLPFRSFTFPPSFLEHLKLHSC